MRKKLSKIDIVQAMNKITYDLSDRRGRGHGTSVLWRHSKKINCTYNLRKQWEWQSQIYIVRASNAITYGLWEQREYGKQSQMDIVQGDQTRLHTFCLSSEDTVKSEQHVWTIKQFSRIHTICRGTKNEAESDRQYAADIQKKNTYALRE